MKYIYTILLLLISFTASADMCNTANPDKQIDYLWDAPKERNNNVPIAPDEIAGYKIYIGSSSGAYECSITISDGAATSYVFKVLGRLYYYAAITTIDTEGNESQYSSEVFIPADEPVEEPPIEVTSPPKPPSPFIGGKKAIPPVPSGDSL